MSKNQMGITFYERQIIELRLRGKWTRRRIARYLNRDHSVVDREIKMIELKDKISELESKIKELESNDFKIV